MRVDFDLVIVGGGLVGASLAAALAGSGLSTALVEAAVPRINPDGAWDSRIYAISPGSAALLRDCGAWQRLDPARIQPVEAMVVFGDARSARLELSAYDTGLPELCHIVESRAIEAALHATLEEVEGLQRFMPAQPASLEFDAHVAVLALEDGRSLRTRLVVGADGAQSWIRSAAGIAATERPYDQVGVVANFETGEWHGAVARQWFRSDGVLALLPLPGNRVSMVWSTWSQRAAELVAASPESLEEWVAAATGNALGDLKLITPARGFALRLLRVTELVRPRLALVGDAAHNVHPLAGQGVNLGFQDVRELAAVLRGRGMQDDCGDRALLRRYERSRREPVAVMQFATDGLQRLFNNEVAGLRWLRNTGLQMTDALPKLKSMLVQHALG
jgi:2-octaprenylphenol hydroxylase